MSRLTPRSSGRVEDKVPLATRAVRDVELNRWAAMSHVIRWLLILPAAVMAWCVALFIGIVLYQGLEALCPTSQVESGHCFAPWFVNVSNGLVAFGAALAATLIMSTCALLAPTHKRQVSVATFLLGALAAIIMGMSAGEYIAMAAAIIAGAITLIVLLRRLPPFLLPNISFERTRGG